MTDLKQIKKDLKEYEKLSKIHEKESDKFIEMKNNISKNYNKKFIEKLGKLHVKVVNDMMKLHLLEEKLIKYQEELSD